MERKLNKWTEIGCIVLAFCTLISSLIGLLYNADVSPHQAINVYGQLIEMYGKGIYSYNAIFTVSNRLGADVMGVIGAALLIVFTLIKKKNKWVKIIRMSQTVSFVYFYFCLLFGITINRLFFLYVFCFGLSIFLSAKFIVEYIKDVNIVCQENKGTGVFLIICGGIIALIWTTMLIPYMISGEFGSLLFCLTTEVTYGLDLGVVCPLLIWSGICVIKKKSFGYKAAPILLCIVIVVAPMVILQNLFCLQLGINVPVPAFIGTVLSFVLLGAISVMFFIRSVKMLEYRWLLYAQNDDDD